MKKNKIYIAFIISFCVCCESAKQDNEIFKPELKNKILSFIKYSDSIIGQSPLKKDMFYAVAFTGQEEPLLYIYRDFFYDKKMLGYTYIDDRLIVCYNFREGYKQHLIDTTKLIPFKDSIPGYRSNIVIDMYYEILKYVYTIDSTDNLSLIYVGF